MLSVNIEAKDLVAYFKAHKIKAIIIIIVIVVVG